MAKLLGRTLVAAALGGAVLAAAPAAQAQSVSLSVGFPGVSFSYTSGGYCDSWGCPDDFWNYPIYYCPVFYNGSWYRGPVYYRYWGGQYSYWIRGAWRRDYWSGPRPGWACVDRYGPPLGLDFYIWNGFNIRDDWRYRWRDHRNDWWRHRQDWDRSHHNDTRWRGWLPQQQQHYDWNRDRNWNTDREWSRPDWNRAEWNKKHNIDRNLPPSQVIIPQGPSGLGKPPANYNRPNNPPTGNDHRDRNRDQGRGNWQGGSSTPSGQINPQPRGNNPPAVMRDHRNAPGNWGQRGQGGNLSSGQTTNRPSGNNPPPDQIRGRGKGKGDQGDRNGPH
jgi:hypothetical protein